MPIPSYTVTCTKNKIIADGIHEIHFTKPKDFHFEPGHFLLMDVPLLDDPKDIQPRAYSIASAPSDEEIILAIKMVPNGRASMWIEKQLTSGMEVHIQGPFGKFLLDTVTKKEYIMMCTATGIAPFRSQLRTILPAGDTRKIDLFFGLLSSKELFWEEELQQLTMDYPNFSYHICASEPEKDFTGFTGYVQELAKNTISDFSNKQVYLCGSPLMTKAVKDVCIKDFGIPKEDVHMEGFM